MNKRPEVKRLLDELGPAYVFKRSDIDLVRALVPAGVGHSTSYQEGEEWLDITIGDTPVRTVQDLRDVLAAIPRSDSTTEPKNPLAEAIGNVLSDLLQKYVFPLADEITMLRARLRVVLDILAERDLLSPSDLVNRYSDTLDRDGDMIRRTIYQIEDPNERAQLEAEVKAWDARERERTRAFVGDEEIARHDAALEAFRARHARPTEARGDDNAEAQPE
jgi:hypothetical protein